MALTAFQTDGKKNPVVGAWSQNSLAESRRGLKWLKAVNIAAGVNERGPSGSDARFLDKIQGELAVGQHTISLSQGQKRFSPVGFHCIENFIAVRINDKGQPEPTEPEPYGAFVGHRELNDLWSFDEHDLRKSKAEANGLNGLAARECG